MRTVLRLTGRGLILVGICFLLFVPFQLWGTGNKTRSAQDSLGTTFERSLQETEWQSKAEIEAALAGVAVGDVVARLEIPSIGVDYFVLQGVDLQTLQSGPGHFPETPLPGQPGNSALAGHRSTYDAPFNLLNELKPGDEVVVTTLQGRFVYEVLPQFAEDGNTYGHRIVAPTAWEILEDKGDNRITLMGCHPRYGSSSRIVVEARLISEPAGLTSTSSTSVVAYGSDALLQGSGGSVFDAVVWFGLALLCFVAMFVLVERFAKTKRLRFAIYVGCLIVLCVILFRFFEHVVALYPVPL